MPDSMNIFAIFEVAEESTSFGILRYIGWLTGSNAFSRIKQSYKALQQGMKFQKARIFRNSFIQSKTYNSSSARRSLVVFVVHIRN